jgi:hypothetical protein
MQPVHEFQNPAVVVPDGVLVNSDEPTPIYAPLALSFSKKGPRIKDDETIQRAIEHQQLGLKSVWEVQPKGRTVMICGFGPSLGDIQNIKTLRKMQKAGGAICTTNMAHDFVMNRALTPDHHVLMDPMPWVANYTKRANQRTDYCIASQCHSDTFRNLKGHKRFIWHADFDSHDGEMEPTRTLTEKGYKNFLAVPGGTTVGLRSFWVMYAIGYRDFHFFGMDSSRRGNKHHALQKPPGVRPLVATQVTLQTKYGAKTFDTNENMAKQADDFEHMVETIAKLYGEKRLDLIRITFHGDGLLPSLAAIYGWHADPDMNAQWQGAQRAA